MGPDRKFRWTREAPGENPAPHRLAPWVWLSIRWGPRESLDTPDDLPKEGPCQVAPDQLQDEVPSMPDDQIAHRLAA